MDLAIFMSICILALSYLFIQATRSSGSRGFIEENENINEVAVRALSSLVQSGGGEIEIKTVQPISMKAVEADFSEDIRKIMRYADAVIMVLDETLQEARIGRSGQLSSDDPYFLYVKSRLDGISEYLLYLDELVGGVISDGFSEAESEKDSPCGTLGQLSDYLPGYGEADRECREATDPFLGVLSGDIAKSMENITFLSRLLDMGGIEALDGIELMDKVKEVRCALSDLKESANSLLTYIETGLNTRVSFLELFPVEVKSEAMTVEQMLVHSSIARGNLVVTDEARSMISASALLLMRNRDMGDMLPDYDLMDDGLKEAEGVKNESEDVLLSPRSPLYLKTNVTAEAPYHELTFGTRTYLTPSGLLGVRMEIWGDDVPHKQKSNYFEGVDYVFDTPSYPDSIHHRTYDGSFVKGKIEETRVSKREKNWTEERNVTPEITARSLIQERKLIRPMTASAELHYGNLSWPNQTYEFDIMHIKIIQTSNYTINLSASDFDYNQSDALKSIIMGTLLSARADMRAIVVEEIERRLDELLVGYEYKFELRDCCKAILEVNRGSEPTGREGVAKYYYLADGSRGIMKLTVWR